MAIANIADETRPWAIIILSDPIHPQAVLDIRPEIMIAIWPTEE